MLMVKKVRILNLIKDTNNDNISKWRNVHRKKLSEVQFITSAMYHTITLFFFMGQKNPTVLNVVQPDMTF